MPDTSLRHQLAHWLGWNHGQVETWTENGLYMVGFRCVCGDLRGVEPMPSFLQRRSVDWNKQSRQVVEAGAAVGDAGAQTALGLHQRLDRIASEVADLRRMRVGR